MRNVQGLKDLGKTTLFIKILLLTGLLFIAGTSSAYAAPEDQLPKSGWSGVRWVHADVSGWAKTATLKSVSIVGSQIVFPYDGGNWPVRIVFGTALAGNCWAMINYGGQWTAFTFDFLRSGQYSKPAHAVEEAAHEAGLHWRPQNGEEIYIWVSGLARTSDRNALERSNVIRYYWNSGTGTPGPDEPSCTAPPKIEYFTGPRAIKKGQRALLRWKITGAEGVGLYASDGTSKKIPSGDIVQGSGYVYPKKTTTYTLKATNECVKDNNLPQKQLTVMVRAGVPWNTSLLLVPKPIVKTGAAPYGSVTGWSARVNGTVDPNHKSANISFEYGLNKRFGKYWTATPALVGGKGVKPVTATLKGLNPGKRYYYRVKAKNGSKVTIGNTRSFVTDNKPAATTRAASGVTGTSATMNSSVNPNGAATTVTFQWGINTNYLNPQVDGNPKVLGGSIPQVSSAKVTSASGLLPGTKYHYRVKAVNNVDIKRPTLGADKTFTTPPLPPVIVTKEPVDNASTSVVLKASVKTNGANTIVRFKMREPPADYWPFLIPQEGITVINTHPSTAIKIVGFDTSNLFGALTSGITYCYRAVANNGTGGTQVAANEVCFQKK